MRFALRGYQRRALEMLERYLGRARVDAPAKAFLVETQRQYRTVAQLPDMPYVCLRIPTGGGKTVLAAHSVGIAAERYLRLDRVVCLWLTPSNTIREQTLARLRDREDPYHQALEERLRGPVTVLDLAEALTVSRGTLDGESVVVVATLQAFRQEETEGRKVYEQNGALQHHFTGLAPGQVAGLECREDGSPIESFANVMRLRHPLIVMDEAHNARTKLSFETLARVRPSCILEFTATPETTHNPEQGRFASNVLAHVSAAELKAEEMIKLPVRLRLRPSSSEAIGEALAQQRVLEAVAEQERTLTGEYIRPIVLFQAEPRREGEERIVAAVLKEILIRDHRIPEEQVAVVTGTVNDLEGVNLSSRECPIRFVITQQALKEGWDCPYAYILCSLANQGGARAVEQLLGRVLRLPQAKRKRHDALNASYAFVVSTDFHEAASGLRDALVENGFEGFDAEVAVEELPAVGLPVFYATPERPVEQAVSAAPPAALLARPELALVSFDPKVGRLSATAPMSADAERVLLEGFNTLADKEAVITLARASRGEVVAASPRTLGATALLMPRLVVVREGRRSLFDETMVMEAEWNLRTRGGELSPAEYPRTRTAGQDGTVDVNQAGRVQISAAEVVSEQLAMLQGERGWTSAQLSVWLDRRIDHSDLTQADVQQYIHRVLDGLIAEGVGIEQLARDKYRLRTAIETRISRFRIEERGKSFQALLFGAGSKVEAAPDLGLVIDAHTPYTPSWIYEGALQFRKHLYQQVGELSDRGEEFGCAAKLDNHPAVMIWVRNLSRRAQSFWLPTSTDKFYPDFVGLLTDSRVFAIEYKGAHLATGDDAKEKKKVGKLWEAASDGKAIFVMPTDTSFGEIDAAFA